MEVQSVMWIMITLLWVFVLAICSTMLILFEDRKEVERVFNYILDFIRKQQEKEESK